MEVEIEVIGTPIKRVFSQTRVSIGTDILCDIRLAAQQFPGVQPEHLVLEVVRGVVKVAAGQLGSPVTLRGGVPLTSGTAIHSGDSLRLAPNGPELRIRLLDWETRVASSTYEPTRVLSAAEVASLDSNLDFTTEAIQNQAVQDPPIRDLYQTAPLPSPKPADRRTATQVWSDEPAPFKPAPAAVPAVPAESDALRRLTGQLKGMQILLGANLLLLVVLVMWLFQLHGEVTESHREILALRSQAKDAVQQFTPALDARLATLQTRMDGMDASLKAAEDRMVQRLDREVPVILDRYLHGKMATAKP